MLLSATFRSQPRVERVATWNVPNSVVTSLLGRLPVGSTATGVTNITINDNDHRLYDDARRAQVDMRIAKVFRFGTRRADVGLDISNLLNTNYATAWDNTYQYGAVDGGTWGNATSIYTPRFVRLNFTLGF